ncbi:MAG TPA: hypothetical protein VL371_14710 [Gemmataceae bacterium]|nr:hypothetical protein [Gemmataceae bacterium]
MKRTLLWALVAINVVLLAALVMPYVNGNTAMAQRAAAGGGRRPEVMLIPGEQPGGSSAVVYLVDTANRRLAAVSLNNKGNGLDVLPPQDLERVFNDRAAPAGGPNNGRGAPANKTGARK